MTITEPSTMITDYVLAAVAVAAAAGVVRANKSRGRWSVRFWAGALGSTGVAAVTGGTYHGFQSILNVDMLASLWKATMFSIGLASFCFASAAIFAAFSGQLRKTFLLVVALQLIAYLLWVARCHDFRYAIYDYASTMVAVSIIQIYVWATRRDAAARWIIGGILISFFGALVLATGLTVHRHFNQNDLYHVLQMGGIYFFYRGGRCLSDRADNAV